MLDKKIRLPDGKYISGTEVQPFLDSAKTPLLNPSEVIASIPENADINLLAPTILRYLGTLEVDLGDGNWINAEEIYQAPDVELNYKPEHTGPGFNFSHPFSLTLTSGREATILVREPLYVNEINEHYGAVLAQLRDFSLTDTERSTLEQKRDELLEQMKTFVLTHLRSIQ